jgi:hypothetical protein
MTDMLRINGLHLLMVGVLPLAAPGAAMPPPLKPADFNGDGDVDSYDVEDFISCLSGEGVAPASECEPADIYGDGDVDQADFGFVQRCISGENVFADPACTGSGPRLSYYRNSGCLSTLLSGDDYPWCGDDAVEIAVEEYSLRITHRNATYNCCPEDIRVELTVAGDTLTLGETEVLTMPCVCLCCYDVESVVVNLPEGYYWVNYCWSDWESGQMCETRLIQIP